LTSFITFWIWLSVLASVAGWTLSALGQLNRAGYTVFTGLALVVWIWVRRNVPRGKLSSKRSTWEVLRKRFRRFLPLSFASLSLLVLLGGLLYAPSNHTGLSYRISRVMHWLAAEGWHWVHTPNYRINDRSCGIEWLTAPLLLFTKSDRGLFLLNFLPFLMLPGLVFSLFTRLGVRARVAWHWMWLLPTGYTFLVQAGSIGNDTFPTVYALAALDFALRARVSGRASEVYLSVLAAAFLNGAKASNLPLLLPWAIAMLGCWRLLFRRLPEPTCESPLPPSDGERVAEGRVRGRRIPIRKIVLAIFRSRPLTTGVIGLLALAASFAPTAILNAIYCGDWSGLVLEHGGMNMKNPFVGVWGNALLLLSNNFVPPFFPMAGWYTHSVLSLLPGFIINPMLANFEQGFQQVWELPTEDWTGLGFGLSVLVVISVVAALRRGRRLTPPVGVAAALPDWLRGGVLLGSWVALLAYCMKSGMVTPARLISPYYPLLIAPLLVLAGQTEVVRRRWWRVAEFVVVLMALGVLVVTPPRPLWPAQTVLSRLEQSWPQSRLLQKASKVYSVYAIRPDPLAEVRTFLPRDVSVVGFIATGDDMDISLWRPFGARRVVHFMLDDPVDLIRARHVEYVVLGGLNLMFENRTLESWLVETGGELVGTVTAEVKVSEGLQPWYVVRIP